MATLYDLAMKYLQQGLPSISGIFPSTIPPIGGTPPTQPPGTPPDPNPDQGIINTGSGDNFSVYNPDPTRLRTADDYSPFNARRFYARPDSDVGIPSGILSDSKFLYGDQVRLPGILGIGQEFLKKVMPVNRRAILENEALGAGIALDDIGRIVQGSGDYNTAENVMAGYNLAKITPETIQKRRDMINKNMKDPEQKAARLKALDDFENKMFGTGGITDLSKGIFDQKSKIKDPTYKSRDELIDLGIKSAEDDDEDDMLEKIIEAQKTGMVIPGVTTGPFPGLSFAPGMNFGVSPLGEFGTGITSIKKPKEKIIVPPEKPSIPKQNIPATPGFDVSGGAGGSYDRGRDYSGASDRTAGDRARTRDARKSDLGFSDIRLKENVELIGKSPSNINIYKFNYKDNPTTYQGVMAHEVPWANVKHDNGYMMVDYNKVDVEFKQWLK